jgi:hypothetical protein
MQQKNTPSNEVYGVVRKVSLKQYGHFMMGIARIMNKSVTVSGCYGNDGLIMDVDSVPAPMLSDCPSTCTTCGPRVVGTTVPATKAQR